MISRKHALFKHSFIEHLSEYLNFLIHLKAYVAAYLTFVGTYGILMCNFGAHKNIIDFLQL